MYTHKKTRNVFTCLGMGTIFLVSVVLCNLLVLPTGVYKMCGDNTCAKIFYKSTPCNKCIKMDRPYCAESIQEFLKC